MPWQDVCPSVRHTPIFRLSKRLYIIYILTFFSPSGSPPFWFFHTKRDGNIPTGTPLRRASNTMGYEKIAIFDQSSYLALSRK